MIPLSCSKQTQKISWFVLVHCNVKIYFTFAKLKIIHLPSHFADSSSCFCVCETDFEICSCFSFCYFCCSFQQILIENGVCALQKYPILNFDKKKCMQFCLNYLELLLSVFSSSLSPTDSLLCLLASSGPPTATTTFVAELLLSQRG